MKEIFDDPLFLAAGLTVSFRNLKEECSRLLCISHTYATESKDTERF